VIPRRCGPNLPHDGVRPFIRVAVLCPILVGATPARSKGAWVLSSQSTGEPTIHALISSPGMSQGGRGDLRSVGKIR
jgi:hypothetical protein